MPDARPLAITYPADLPITDRRAELLDAIAGHQVVVVAGETGSGKSTQLPKLCMELGRGVDGWIGHTQPRRVAARTIAERVADELGTDLGDVVGYSVRFNDRVGAGTRVKVMTDGILLAEIQRDRMLRRYDTLIIDEAHERSLNIDFLLGYLKQLLPRRPDLKLIITSATIDTARFAEHFGGHDGPAPIIEVSGRSYPVEVRYRPYGELIPADEGDDVIDDDRDQVDAVCDAVLELSREGPGDVLVFLSGEREIRDTADALAKLTSPAKPLAGTEILPMYARLSAAEQHKVFEPHRGRRVVLATNVAETSITVPGVRYVVDAGTARVLRYSHRLKVQRLPIEAVSQASANQRAGRCGRVAPGICIRLYGEDDYEARPEFTDPEILRTNLASVILQMTNLGLGDVAGFPFLDPPDHRAIRDGVLLLEELNALPPDQPADRRRLTKVGKHLARLPIDPRMARMIVEADRQNCVREVLIIAAALSIQDPRERPTDKEQLAAEMHKRFAVAGSDFLALVKLWDHLAERREALSSNQFRRECRAEYLNYLRVREWIDLHRQLKQAAARIDIRPVDEGGDAHPDQVHKAILSGLLSHLGMKEKPDEKAAGRNRERGQDRGRNRAIESREFRGARNARFQIAPGSSLARKPPAWAMAAELVETNRLWARMAAAIQPEWAEKLGAHLVKRSYGEPRWDERSGRAVTTEQVTLYGLPIVSGRRVGYDVVDRDEARDLFIEHALVRREWDSPHDFLVRNDDTIEAAEALGARMRTVVTVDGDALFHFYDERVPDDVVSARHFDRWWKKARRDVPKSLDITVAQVLGGHDDDGLDPAEFPDTWQQGDLRFPITYRFDPGHDLDGATVHIPMAVLNRVEPWDFDWQVPGLRRELVVALVRSLPKDLRRHLTPLNETAERAADLLEWQDLPIAEALADVLSSTSGARIPAEAIDARRLPPHLRITFAVTQPGDGDREATPSTEVVAVGKDLLAVKDLVGGRVRAAVADALATAHTASGSDPSPAQAIERSGITRWDFGDLPAAIHSTITGPDGSELRVDGYPALLDRGDSVEIKVFSKPEIAERIMAGGIRRLVLLSVPVGVRGLEGTVPNRVRLAVPAVPELSLGKLLRDCISAAADHVVTAHGGSVRTEDDFAGLLARARAELRATATRALKAAGEVVVHAAEVTAQIDGLVNPVVQPAVADAREQLHRLVRPGFVTSSGVDRLADLARYVTAIGRRLDKVGDAPARDRQHMAEVLKVEDDYRKLLAALAPSQVTRRVVEAGWMIEELRVSLFAQSLGTKGSVSAKRITRELDDLFAGNLD
ncbi:MAG: ATP-dependent RNA helicase HrpA [Acidimicrobiales bacterium]|nr:ATP-dependent RNA helicase HrpA [Acidimicrobiales bacterium]